MKIKSKILIFFAIIITLIIIIFSLISIYLKDNYINIKYNRASNYYYQRDITLDEYSEYLMNHGFIVSTDEIQKYISSSDLTCHLDSKEIVIYENDKPVLYAVINEKIADDFLLSLNILFVSIGLLLLILLVVIYYFIEKIIINRIKVLELKVTEFESTRKVEIYEEKYKDEITDLFDKFKSMANSINNQDQRRKELIIALSHELKTPISKIEAILQLYDVSAEGYSDKKDIINNINSETSSMTENINKLLTVYSTLENKVDIEDIDLNEYIRNLFNNEMLLSKSITVDITGSHTIEVDKNKFNIMINNLVNNIYKYATENSIVKININENEIIISNEIKEQKNSPSSKMGNVINQYIVEEIGVEISSDISNDKYITRIEIL